MGNKIIEIWLSFDEAIEAVMRLHISVNGAIMIFTMIFIDDLQKVAQSKFDDFKTVCNLIEFYFESMIIKYRRQMQNKCLDI
jgi:hypothetical protein